MKRVPVALAVGLLASPLVAAPASASLVPTDPLAATQATAVEVATFWLGNGGANLANATPYNIQTSVRKVISAGGASGTEPGVVPPVPPADAGDTDTKTPTTSGKVFFIGADGLPHWCSGTAVQSQYRNVVATAGHCVYDTQRPGSTLDRWVFVPGYSAGTAPWGLYVGKQVAGHYDFLLFNDYDRDYAFVNVYSGVVSSASHEVTDVGTLVDNVGGQGLAWNQPSGSAVDVFGYPAGPHPDGTRPYTGQTLESSSGRTTTAQAPSVKAEEFTAVDSPFTGEGSLGSSWLLGYHKSKLMGYLNGMTVSVADTDGDLRFDTSLSPYFDGELFEVYQAADISPSGSILPA
ncbi:hypothetical protein FH608_008955 [Nonomuraea phyllanthi]|uniref:Uncharacterized protein n=2 Tax=Nonomuraea phyllanthi TaxID=2219224 RepID=A0A5C4WW42_9ACTN|nr:hypothetical protein FH608_008955 [Nonomuraea phyllanthi]QFY15004.1 hypothetical protein GBF35_48995 [Nonomuraea phyllanthi]